ncbi:MAG: cyclase family protein [Desulfobacteraceae bacterium]|nr:cyclase family protein [Desulfobacteraceae bacterium]
MKIVDLTHHIMPDMPVYPGTEQPVFRDIARVKTHGFAEKQINMVTHTGTHMDAPAHMIPGGKTLDQLPLDFFYGPAVCVSVPEHRPVIDIRNLLPVERQIEAARFILFHTGWDRYWGTERYFSEYPVLSAEATVWLAGFKLKGVGFDTISADSADTSDFSNHHHLLGNAMVIIENLRGLNQLPPSGFVFSCFPLKIKDADGSPVRAVAMV